MRSVALIMIMAITMSSLFFCFIDDWNYAATVIEAPALKKLVYSETKSGEYQAVLTWQAKQGMIYQVLRKKSENSKYAVIATVKASSATGKYTDKSIGKNRSYTYSVRRVTMKNGKVKTAGSFDPDGLTTLRIPSLSVTFNNLNAGLSWREVYGATRYRIYRRVGKSTEFYNIKNVSSDTTSYKDWWYWSTGKLKDKDYSKTLAGIITRRLRGTFLDMSNNPVSYRVQAYYSKTVDFVKKESYGLFLKDGEFRLEPPTITDVTSEGVLTWGHVANAEGYYILKSSDASVWTKIGNVGSKGGDYIDPDNAADGEVFQDYRIPDYDKNAYYAVRAYASRNGSTVYSNFDKGFTARNRDHHEKVLFLGDSLTYGSPYYGNERKAFAYVNRISQLTGVTFFNPSVPGATYHFAARDGAEPEEDSDLSASNIVTGVANMMVKGENTDKLRSFGIGTNKSRIADYDVVVLAAGTNDYIHYDPSLTSGSELFGSRETDWELVRHKTKNLTFTINKGTKYEKQYTENYDYNIKTFDGAYNQIMKWIEEASVYRVQHGKKPIQVVTIGLFYSDRAKKPHTTPTSRNMTKNSLGLTLKDYQAELDALDQKWGKSPALDIYHYDSQKSGIVSNKNCQYMSSDNLHYTKYAYALYGNDISKFMIRNILGREKNVRADSRSFIALAARHRMLSERMAYLEDVNNTEGMKAYVNALYQFGYLHQMLSECSEEERARYEEFIQECGLGIHW